MRTILDVTEPIIKAYVHHGFPLSMIGKEWVESGWVYNKFIQLEYHVQNPDDVFIDFIFYNFFEQDDVFIKGFYQLPYETEREVKEYLRLFKERIKDGAYIFGTWNEQLIPGTSLFRKKFAPHANLIYGYDDKKKTVFTEGYLKDRHWHRFEVSYNDYLSSLIGYHNREPEGFVGFDCFYRNDISNGGLDMKQVKEELYHYLNSSSKSKREGVVYGTEGLIRMYEDFDEICRNNGRIPWQSLYIVYEHKKMMLERLKRIKAEGMSVDSDCIKQYEGICKNFNLIVNYGVKYVLDGEAKWGSKMNELAKSEMMKEKDILWKLYDNI